MKHEKNRKWGMRRCLFLLLVIIVPEILNAQDAIIENDENHITVNSTSPTGYTWECSRTVKILNSRADDAADFSMQIEKGDDLEKFSAVLMDDQGNIIRKIKQGDLQRTEYTPELASDAYTLYIDIAPSFYPVTIVFNWKVKSDDNVLSFPPFIPQNDYEETVENASYSITVPKNYHYQYKVLHTSVNPLIRTEKNGNITTTFAMQNLKALSKELFVPSLKDRVPAIYFSPVNFDYFSNRGTLDSWKSMGLWMHQLDEGRDLLSDDAIAKIKEVTKNCTTDKEKIVALYQMLGKNTRYVNLNLGIGGFQPMSACDVWRLGFGDCKALSNEMKAMLKVVGIPSRLVAIGLDARNLMVNMPNFQQMDHMILEIPLPKDTCFVECTNTDLPLGYIHDFIRGHQALEISQDGGRLIRLPHYCDSQNLQTTVIHAELLSDNSVNFTINDDFQNGCYEDRLKLMMMKRQEQQDYLLSLYRLPQAENIEDSIVNEKEPFVTPHLRTWLKANCRDYVSITNSRIFLPLCPQRADDYIQLDTSRKDSIIINEGYRNDETIIWHLPEGYKVESMPGVVDVKSPEANYYSNTIQNGREVTQHNIFQLNEGCYPVKDVEVFNTVWQDKSNIERSRIILKKQ
jgi:transglutaminase-like putative cysteine protease